MNKGHQTVSQCLTSDHLYSSVPFPPFGSRSPAGPPAPSPALKGDEVKHEIQQPCAKLLAPLVKWHFDCKKGQWRPTCFYYERMSPAELHCSAGGLLFWAPSDAPPKGERDGTFQCYFTSYCGTSPLNNTPHLSPPHLTSKTVPTVCPISCVSLVYLEYRHTINVSHVLCSPAPFRWFQSGCKGLLQSRRAPTDELFSYLTWCCWKRNLCCAASSGTWWYCYINSLQCHNVSGSPLSPQQLPSPPSHLQFLLEPPMTSKCNISNILNK